MARRYRPYRANYTTRGKAKNTVKKYHPPSGLRDARLALGWSQAKLAKKVGVHRETITRMEMRGYMPRRKTWERILKVMRLGYDDLYTLFGKNSALRREIAQLKKELGK